MTSISGILFLSKDHRTLYVMPHDHTDTIRHHSGTESKSAQVTYTENRGIIYKIALMTGKTESAQCDEERITSSQILPQPRVGSHHSTNTFKVLLGTDRGRLF